MQTHHSRYIGLFAVLILLGAGCLSFQQEPTKEEDNSQENTPEQSAQAPEKTTDNTKPVEQKAAPKQAAAPSPAPTPAPTPAPATNCSTAACVAELAKTCTQGEASYTVSMPFILDPEGGLTIHTKMYSKIIGPNADGACVLFQQPKGGSVTLTAEGRIKAIEEGLTEEQIDAMIKTMGESLNSEEQLKTVTTCTGDGAEMAKYLTSFSQGSFEANCDLSFATGESTCRVSENLVCVSKIQP